ncbi:M20 family metallopeptidase [Chondromyces apiculatus]|uniref:Succinyl-diaminopimelate desuccinylase n=1 Tax=Chondromyces apiculatus DSM 436 TaxID=1192034 RepID=A0A017TCC6_9BACT|nr:M20 family metallopeptidase [Chondromyces apiculatus]EYF06938.1 succinyl-diaminopimelate desuccinylase [Chondromyces apiculatus DSM 436]
MSTKLSIADVEASADRAWEQEIVPALVDYIRIPNKSPSFDPAWREHGHMDRAVELIAGWCQKQPIEGLTVEVVRLEGRTPVIYIEIPARGGGAGKGEGAGDTVLLYGHLDKQPEMVGWREPLGPWEPVREGDKLYGRGGADDGYSAFASLLALRLVAEQGLPHARCVVLIEACEESGSPDLPAYVDALAERIGKPSLIVCLDSGCGNYEQLWTTTSLRGLVQGTLEVRILREGVHSGAASGIVPSTFRITRQLLSRIEDEDTGEVRVGALHVDIPPARMEQAGAAAAVLGSHVHDELPFVGGARPTTAEGKELLLRRTWRPALSVTGAEGLPPIANAGNVLRPFTKTKLSMRIPPRLDPRKAAAALKETLEKDPPYGAEVSFKVSEPSSGWDAPALAPWLEKAMETASLAFFGKPAIAFGEGGTIPFMAMLGDKFPEAQFLITGVLGPQSNAHGPNEFLHLAYGKKLTCCVASILADHASRQ